MSLTIADAIHDQAVESGFTFPTRGETPELPPDVTVISSAEVMQLMVKFTVMVGFAATEEALARVKAKSMAFRYKSLRGRRYIALRQDDRMTETERNAELDCDDELVELKKVEIAAEGYAVLVSALRSDLDGKYNVLSRELTRRGVSAERHFD